MARFTGDRPVLVAAAGAVAGVAALALYALSLGPVAVAIGDLDRGMVDTRVEVTGVVDGVRETSGGLVLILVDPLDRAEVRVFVPDRVAADLANRESLVPGAEVRVQGEVQLYQDALEIVVLRGDGVTVLREPTG